MANKSKITVLQVIHSMHIGGAENVVANLTSRINPDLFDIKVYCISEEGVLADGLRELDYEVYCGDGLRHFKVYNPDLEKTIRRLNPDITHSHGTAAIMEMVPVRLLNKLPPWVHTFHYGNYPYIKKQYLYSERIFARFADQLIAVSDFQKNMIARNHWISEHRIQTLHNGVEDQSPSLSDEEKTALKQEFGINAEDYLVGTIAVLSRQKGISFLLHAAERVIKHHSNAKLLIVGGGHLQDQLEEQTGQSGLKDRVVFTGWRNDALKIMQLFDVFILPSLWEAFSVVVLEAMAAARPIILTDVADHRNIIQHGESGLIIEPSNVEAISDAIDYMIENSQEALAMGQRARHYFLENFTISNMIREHEALYTRLSH